ncbi:MAG: hypothetical protein ACR2PK_01105 [Acidimicrobiales bacterium]
MGLSRVLSRAPGCAVVAVVLLSAACSPDGADNEAGDSRGAADTAQAMEVLVASDAAEAPPALFEPELLGLEGAQPEPLPLALALSAVGADPQGSDTEQSGSADDGDLADEADAGAPDDVATTGETDGSEEGEVGRPLPDPPPAGPGSEAPYDDPSSAIISASGRSFDLFAPGLAQHTTRGVTEDSILVAGLASETLIGDPFRQDVCLGAAARFNQANSHSELSRQIEFEGCYDDHGQNERSSLLATGLVRDEVFAAVPIGTSSFLAHDLLEAENIPYIGADKLPGFCGRENPIGFGTIGARGCPVLDARGFVTFIEPVLTAYAATLPDDAEVSQLTYVVTDDPEGQSVAASRAFEAELSGIVAPTLLALLPNAVTDVVVDWSDISESILASSPQVVVLDGPNVAGLPASLRDAEFDGEIVVVGVVDPVDVADDTFRSELGPVTVITQGMDLANRGASGWESIVGAAASVQVSMNDIGSDFILGYVTADFFVRAVESTPEPLSVEGLADTINNGWWYPGVEGIACGSWWPASHYISTPCVSVSRVDMDAPYLIPVQGLVETAPQLRFHLTD